MNPTSLQTPDSVIHPLQIAVVGSGIAGLSAAWLLSQRHRVTLIEAEPRPGGHSNTVDVRLADGKTMAVDTGFIVYNELTYPNLTALLAHLMVPTTPTEMTFGLSLDGGALEYAGSDLNGLFAQRSNLVRPRFWSMLRDLLRFYRQAPKELGSLGMMTLDEFLDSRGYGHAVRHDHLYPMAAAIWSTPASEIGRYPVAAFVRFCENHRLLSISDRPLWRTVQGGSINTVRRLIAALGDGVRLQTKVTAIERHPNGVTVITEQGALAPRFDHVVLATHADEALQLIAQPSAAEARLLGAFSYNCNHAVLHSDPRWMPQRRAVWSSWNYLAERDRPDRLCVSYWMNRLQSLSTSTPLVVTLNPPDSPQHIHYEKSYTHPLFDAAALSAQAELWSLQGQQRTWYCGAYFGAGFHEDGLQAGLAVAEALGGVRRPWNVPNESGRIALPTKTSHQ